MALKPCKECRTEVSTSAKTCPKCGVAEPTVTAWDKAVGLLMLVGLIGAGYVLYLTSGSNEPATARSEARARPTPDLTIHAWTACQMEVKKRLVAPATASFPWDARTYTTQVGGALWRVRSHVDSENRLGAKVRETFDCFIRVPNTDTWELDSLEIG